MWGQVEEGWEKLFRGRLVEDGGVAGEEGEERRGQGACEKGLREKLRGWAWADSGDQTQKHMSGLEDRVKLSKEAAAPGRFLTPHSGHRPPSTGL